MEPSGYEQWPDYRVDLLRRRNRFTVTAGDVVLASSERCLLVDEQDHGLVIYFPREDVHLDHLEPTDRGSRCPFKGNASYWRLAGGGTEEREVAWTYDDPYPQVAQIAGYVAFFQDLVTVAVGVATPAVSGR
jgi:uncharacterized protein (DUF427 family)